MSDEIEDVESEEIKETNEETRKQIKVVTIMAKLEGVKPHGLMMSPMAEDNIDATLVRGEREAPRRDVPKKKIAAERLYREDENADGKIGLPEKCLFAALREAGRKVKMDGRTYISTASTTTLPSFLTFMDTFFPLIVPGGDPEKVWVVDLRRGVLRSGANKTAVGIIRPRFKEWSIEVTFEVRVHGGMTVDKARQLFEIAGDRIGVGSFRPSCNGQFGRFRVVAWEVMEEKLESL